MLIVIHIQNMYDLRKNSLGLLTNFLYYNYSFQNPYQGFSPHINNNLNYNNNNLIQIQLK